MDVPASTELLGLGADAKGFWIVAEQAGDAGGRELLRRAVSAAGLGRVELATVAPGSGIGKRVLLSNVRSQTRWADLGQANASTWVLRVGTLGRVAVELVTQLGALLEHATSAELRFSPTPSEQRLRGLVAWAEDDSVAEHRAGARAGDSVWVVTKQRSRARATVISRGQVREAILSDWGDGPLRTSGLSAAASSSHLAALFHVAGESATRLEARWLSFNGQLLRHASQALPAPFLESRHAVLLDDGALYAFGVSRASGGLVGAFGFDARGVALAPQTTASPLVDSERSVALVCKGRPWFVFVGESAPPGTHEIRATSVDTRGHLTTPIVLAALAASVLGRDAALSPMELRLVATCTSTTGAFAGLVRKDKAYSASVVVFGTWAL